MSSAFLIAATFVVGGWVLDVCSANPHTHYTVAWSDFDVARTRVIRTSCILNVRGCGLRCTCIRVRIVAYSCLLTFFFFVGVSRFRLAVSGVPRADGAVEGAQACGAAGRRLGARAGGRHG